MEMLLEGDIWSQVNNLLTSKIKKKACIAYVTSTKLKLHKGDVLITDASDYCIKQGQTSAKALAQYFKGGVLILSNPGLHSKLLWTDRFLVIGSANLSESSAGRLREASVVTYDENLRSQANAFCYNVEKGSKLLSEKDIKTKLKIKVIKNKFNPSTKAIFRTVTFGDKCWFIPVYLLTPREEEKYGEYLEKREQEVSIKENIDEEGINSMYVAGKSRFAKHAKVGDRVVLRFYGSKNKAKSELYPPCTIFRKEVRNGLTWFFYDYRMVEKQKVSWSKFQKLASKGELTKNLDNRKLELSKEDVIKLRPLWKK
jgi:hypothetical protein